MINKYTISQQIYSTLPHGKIYVDWTMQSKSILTKNAYIKSVYKMFLSLAKITVYVSTYKLQGLEILSPIHIQMKQIKSLWLHKQYTAI